MRGGRLELVVQAALGVVLVHRGRPIVGTDMVCRLVMRAGVRAGRMVCGKDLRCHVGV
jgi:hypothetical protein